MICTATTTSRQTAGRRGAKPRGQPAIVQSPTGLLVRGAVKSGPVLPQREPGPDPSVPIPQMSPDEVGVVISQSIVAFSRRKLVTDF
jgi:hypothetical protein